MSLEGFSRQSFFSQAASIMQSIRGGCAMAMWLVLFLAACVSHSSQAETVIVSTVAGSVPDFADGQGSSARFDRGLSGITIDAAGNLYVTDGSRIRKVTPQGEVSTLAGERSFADGQESAAWFGPLHGITTDAAGNLYVADTGSNRIRKVAGETEFSTLAGGERGFADGQGRAARFAGPFDIVIDTAGTLYAADYGNHRIRKVTRNAEVSTLAGSESGFADGQGSAARFNSPIGIAIDAVGNLYVVDLENHRIRKVTPEGEVSTLAGGEQGFADGQGSAAQFYFPFGIAIDAAGNLYVADTGNSRIRKVTPEGEVSTLAGSEKGFSDGQGSAARFNAPTAIAIDAVGNLYVTDRGNSRIRKIVIQRP